MEREAVALLLPQSPLLRPQKVEKHCYNIKKQKNKTFKGKGDKALILGNLYDINY